MTHAAVDVFLVLFILFAYIGGKFRGYRDCENDNGLRPRR
jgi:hypothetical protein